MYIRDRYAVIGYPIEHSLSPLIHQAFAKQTGQLLTYERLLAKPDQFISTVRAFVASGGKGLNVTQPFKEAAWLLMDQYSERAARAKAVNTIVCQPDGSLYGDNTDGIGLVRDLTQNLGWQLRGQTILLIGAGGAVRGVLGALLDQQPAHITVANRTVEKAQQLAKEFPIVACSLEKIVDQDFDMVINGTSAIPIVGFRKLNPTYLYDMNYAERSVINADSGEHIANGWGMLVEQAAESFFLWRGVRPDTLSLTLSRKAGEGTFLYCKHGLN